MLIGCYNPSVILTYIGICVSIMGILNAHDLKFAFICLMIAGVCDMFDGPIARKCKRDDLGKAFGIQIDTLADVTNFVVFPMVLFNAIVHTSSTEVGANLIKPSFTALGTSITSKNSFLLFQSSSKLLISSSIYLLSSQLKKTLNFSIFPYPPLDHPFFVSLFETLRSG